MGRAGTTDAALSPLPQPTGQAGAEESVQAPILRPSWDKGQMKNWLPKKCLPSLGTAWGPGAAAEMHLQLLTRKPGDSVVGS